MHEFEKVVKNYKFVALWVSQILSQFSINVLSFVIIIHIFEQTGSTIASSLLWVTYAIPAVIFGPFAAAWVDLVDKRKVLMMANILQALVVLGFAILLYKNLIYLSYIVVFLYSFLNQFYVPSEAATLPRIVPKKDLPSANGLFFITQQSSLVVGFGLAGIIDAILGYRASLIFISICLFSAFISVSFLTRERNGNKLPGNFEVRVSKFFGQIVEGYHFIKNTRSVLIPFSLLLGVQVVLSVIVINLPSIAMDLVGVSARSSGIVVIIPAGIGAIAATILIPKLLNKRFEKDKIIFASLFMLSLAIITVGVAIPFIKPNVARTATAVVLFFLAGVGTVGTLVPSVTYLQEQTPKGLLGRVFGNFWFLTTLATILPILFSATITDLLGVRVFVITLGIICLAATIVSERSIKKYV